MNFLVSIMVPALQTPLKFAFFHILHQIPGWVHKDTFIKPSDYPEFEG